MHFILFGKSFHQIVFVLIDTLCEIVCHTDIKSSISLTGENIDEVPFHDKGLDPCLRRDDKVSAQRIPIQPVEIESLLDLLFYKFATYLRKNLNLHANPD